MNTGSFAFGIMLLELKRCVPIYMILKKILHSKDTYVVITFLFFQMAVCETSSTFTIRNKLAVKTGVIYLTL